MTLVQDKFFITNNGDFNIFVETVREVVMDNNFILSYIKDMGHDLVLIDNTLDGNIEFKFKHLVRMKCLNDTYITTKIMRVRSHSIYDENDVLDEVQNDIWVYDHNENPVLVDCFYNLSGIETKLIDIFVNKIITTTPHVS